MVVSEATNLLWHSMLHCSQTPTLRSYKWLVRQTFGATHPWEDTYFFRTSLACPALVRWNVLPPHGKWAAAESPISCVRSPGKTLQALLLIELHALLGMLHCDWVTGSVLMMCNAESCRRTLSQTHAVIQLNCITTEQSTRRCQTTGVIRCK